MKDHEDHLTPGIIFLFWVPLALTWLMMALEGPIVASVIARLQEAKLNLAAYGVALSVAFISEGPIIMLVSTATALVRNYSSYKKLLRFAVVLNGLDHRPPGHSHDSSRFFLSLPTMWLGFLKR